VKAVKHRKELGIPINRATVFRPDAMYLADDEFGDAVVSEFYPFNRDKFSPREQLSEVIKLCDVTVIMHHDHAELTGMLLMEIPLSEGEEHPPHASQEGRGLGRG
jgi:hypothetical protein